jgi:serine/threonine protein kinase
MTRQRPSKNPPEKIQGGETAAGDSSDSARPQTDPDRTLSEHPDAADSSGWHGPPVGALIDGTYRVMGPLGEGGMGLVALAIDERLQREVAIKFIRPSLVSREKARSRFLSEARAMARVHHENVVEIYSFGETDGMPYFVMEYVPGSNIALWINDATQGRVLPPVDVALGFLDQICRGLSAIHASSLVHGDLKPTNVLIGPASRVAIADLGMSRVLDQLGKHAEPEIGGTPSYMAPELARANAPPGLAHRADIYALGVIAFEMLTGEAPFLIKNITDVLKIDQMKPPRPSERRRELPPGFDQALLGAVHPDPEKRTASADEFRRSLLAARETVVESYQKLRVLVADDDPDFTALARETLQHAFPGARIECVSDGNMALESIDREPASLAVIDLDMPGMNGLELTAALRGSPSSRRMPIIVVTAAGGAPDWTLLSALGADGFLVKPIDPFALVAVARKTVRAAALTRG